MGTSAEGTPSPARLRAFVREHTRLQPVAGLPRVRLQIARDVMALCQQTGRLLGDPDPDLPYWAFPWAGGLAVAHHLQAFPEVVSGRRVLDLGTGSGLCAIVAAQAGASEVLAVDTDPLAVAAASLNARANHVPIVIVERDLVAGKVPEVDVILAGDVCYQEPMANRILPWLAEAAARGTVVLLGDPGRAYLPKGLRRVACYEVRTSHELEDGVRKLACVFAVTA